MKILVSGDFAKLIKSLENLSLDEKLAPFAEKTLAVSLSDKAEANARNVIGNGPARFFLRKCFLPACAK